MLLPLLCLHVIFVTANFEEDRTLPDTDVKRHVHEGRRAKPWFDPLLISSSGWLHFNGQWCVCMCVCVCVCVCVVCVCVWCVCVCACMCVVRALAC